MAEETNEAVATAEPVAEATETTDETTDWKAKAEELETKLKETGIKNRERTKALKDQLSDSTESKTSDKKETKTDEFGLLELTFLKSDKIETEDEINLVKEEMKVAGYDSDRLPELLKNPYFQQKLETLRTAKANQEATSDVAGAETQTSGAKDKPEYWVAKGDGSLPEKTPANRKLRADIARLLIKQSKSSKTYYND